MHDWRQDILGTVIAWTIQQQMLAQPSISTDRDQISIASKAAPPGGGGRGAPPCLAVATCARQRPQSAWPAAQRRHVISAAGRGGGGGGAVLHEAEQACSRIAWPAGHE